MEDKIMAVTESKMLIEIEVLTNKILDVISASNQVIHPKDVVKVATKKKEDGPLKRKQFLLYNSTIKKLKLKSFQTGRSESDLIREAIELIL